MQKLLIPILIFFAVLFALMYGEGLLMTLFAFLEDLFSLVMNYWADFYHYASDFIRENPSKILLALIITLIASIWVFRQHGETLNTPASKRKFSILLAIFLGFLGIHRFYLKQFGYGILYLFIGYFFTPLVVLISFIDAARFAFLNDEEFAQKYRLH